MSVYTEERWRLDCDLCGRNIDSGAGEPPDGHTGSVLPVEGARQQPVNIRITLGALAPDKARLMQPQPTERQPDVCRGCLASLFADLAERLRGGREVVGVSR